ncbi:MAG: UbiA family prenyltransferase, partial [Acidimicrobiales bacterium]
MVQSVGTEPSEEPTGARDPAGTGRDPSTPVPPRSPMAILTSLRPRQWVKNLLVFVAPAAAGHLGHASTVAHAIAAFGVFVAVASGMYLINDVLDIEADRVHPEKCNRPVAAGLITITQALSVGAALVAAGLAATWFIAGWHFLVVMALYVVISGCYSLWVKYVAVVELASVASGFVLRAIAGGIATGVPLSDWFLAVT